jgi:hypothetical protein
LNAVTTAFLFDKNKILMYNIYIKKGMVLMEINYLDDFVCDISCEEYYNEEYDDEQVLGEM